MKVYEQIKDMLCDELEGIAKKKELTAGNLDVLYKAVDIVKDIETIEAMQEGGYSGEGYSGRMIYDGDSYARGRRRDSRGRYSRDYSERGYSRDYSGEYDDGYSRDTKEELRMMMDRAKDEREREALRKALDGIR